MTRIFYGTEVWIMDNVDSYDTMNDQTYVAEQKNDALCLAGLISSIVSLVCCCGTVSLISLALSIIGVVRVNKNGQAGKGMGIAGIIISVVSILLLIVIILLIVLPSIFFFGFLGKVIEAGISNNGYVVTDHGSYVQQFDDSDIADFIEYVKDYKKN